MNQSLKELLLEEIRISQKALKHLQYAFDRVKILDLKVDMQLDSYEKLDSFSSRYMRLYEVLFNQLIRTSLQLLDEYKDTRLDNLNQAEKLGFIESVQIATQIRINRNKIAHEYLEDQWIGIYQDLIETCPMLIACLQKSFDQIESRKLNQ